MNQSESILLEYIKLSCRGRDHAQTGQEIARIFGCDKRKIQLEIQTLRQEYYPVLSTDNGSKMGYYWPTEEDLPEVKKILQSMRNRALNTLKTVQNINKGLEAEFGDQLPIEFKEVSGL
jgi:biotin operon repressor